MNIADRTQNLHTTKNIISAVSMGIFYVEQIMFPNNVVLAKRIFWIVNIWILAFIPLSALYITLLSLPLAPYPLRPDNLFVLLVFGLIYITLCLCVVFMQIKSSRRR